MSAGEETPQSLTVLLCLKTHSEFSEQFGESTPFIEGEMYRVAEEYDDLFILYGELPVHGEMYNFRYAVWKHNNSERLLAIGKDFEVKRYGIK